MGSDAACYGSRVDERAALLEVGQFLRRVDEVDGVDGPRPELYVEAALLADLANDGLARRFTRIDPAAGEEEPVWCADDGEAASMVGRRSRAPAALGGRAVPAKAPYDALR